MERGSSSDRRIQLQEGPERERLPEDMGCCWCAPHIQMGEIIADRIQVNPSFVQCGNATAQALTLSCKGFRLSLAILAHTSLALSSTRLTCVPLLSYSSPPNSRQREKFNTARFELHQLLHQQTLTGVPLLVVRRGRRSLKAAVSQLDSSWATRTTSMGMPA